MNDRDLASDLQQITLEQVRELFEKMTSAGWKLALQGKTDEEKKAADLALVRVQSFRLKLGNAQLAGIRDKLLANEQELRTGTAEVKQALKKLEDVKRVLDTATSFLDTVARLVS